MIDCKKRLGSVARRNGIEWQSGRNLVADDDDDDGGKRSPEADDTARWGGCMRHGSTDGVRRTVSENARGSGAGALWHGVRRPGRLQALQLRLKTNQRCRLNRGVESVSALRLPTDDLRRRVRLSALLRARSARNVRRILVMGVNAPLPPEAKKILKI